MFLTGGTRPACKNPAPSPARGIFFPFRSCTSCVTAAAPVEIFPSADISMNRVVTGLLGMCIPPFLWGSLKHILRPEIGRHHGVYALAKLHGGDALGFLRRDHAEQMHRHVRPAQVREIAEDMLRVL